MTPGTGKKGPRVPGTKPAPNVFHVAFDPTLLPLRGEAVGERRGIIVLSTYQVGDFARQVLGQVIHR